MASVKQTQPDKPGFVVLFEEATEKNAALLSDALGFKRHRRENGCTILENATHRARVFDALGVAVCDIDDVRLKALRQHNRVAGVYENELRQLPSHAFTSWPGPQAVMGPTGAAAISWGLQAIGVDETTPLTGRGVKIAILDTGLAMDHPDFAGRFREGENVRSLVTGVSATDTYGHGTHCAGVLAASANSVSGLRYSVAPGADLHAGRVFNAATPSPRASDDDILEGIVWADEKQCRVISLSLGTPRQPGAPFAGLYEPLAARLLARKEKSVLLIAAAGNDSRRPWIRAAVENPAACPSIFCVGAVDAFGRIAPFSNGQADAIGGVNLSGPGVGIYSSYLQRGFASLDGTSMATPHVAGLAALYLERLPQLNARELGRMLVQRAFPLGPVYDFGAGLAAL